MAIDDRPRKKKRKNSNAALWIGVGVGAGVLFVIAVVLVVMLVVNAMGDPGADALAKARAQAALLAAQKPADPPPAKPAQPKFADIGEKKRDSTNIRLRIERTARLHELAQIKLFYMQYGDGSKPPPTVDAFVKSMGPDGQAIKQAIEEKYYVIVPNVRSGVIAYEFDPDTRSMHGFIDTMGGAREMSSQELETALKEQRK